MSSIAVSVVGSVVGGIFGNKAADTQADAAKSAADSSYEATKYASDLQYKMYQEGVAAQKPWMDAGKTALNQLSYGMGLAGSSGTGTKGDLQQQFGMQQFQADPGYQFRLSEGIKALDRSASARGGIASGSALKAATNYGQDAASAEYQNAYSRYTAGQAQRYNQLAGLANTGQTVSANTANAGQNYASNTGNLTMTNAANQGNAAIAAGNAQASSYAGWGNAISGGINAIGQYYGNR